MLNPDASSIEAYLRDTFELYSLKEQITYTPENTTLRLIDGIYLVTSPTGEPLVIRRR